MEEISSQNINFMFDSMGGSMDHHAGIINQSILHALGWSILPRTDGFKLLAIMNFLARHKSK